MADSMAEVLGRHLHPADFRRVEALSRGWTTPLFEYDPELAVFQVSAVPTEDEDSFDALMRAADVLTLHRHELDPMRYSLHPVKDTTAEVSLAFPPERGFVVDKMEELLAETDYQVDSSEMAGGRRGITVTFTYRSEWDYARQKEHIHWLADMAARVGLGRGFQGERY